MVGSRVRLSPEDKASLLAYWKYYEPIAGDIGDSLRKSLAALPEWAPLLHALTPSQIAEQDRRNLELQRRAIVDGDWAPYLQDLHHQGVQYAKMGVTFLAWYDVLAIFRETIRKRLADMVRRDAEHATAVADGMNRFVDIAMSHIGDAYLAAKEQIIVRQQEAIRELSLPVLQVQPHLLIVPLVGMIDSARARQLTERLLVEVRDRRAQGVVIDVTGVPVVDSAVASYLVQTCEAARLMGAQVAITGVSSEIAQALVAIGARLADVPTLVDLQEGIDQMSRTLGIERCQRST